MSLKERAVAAGSEASAVSTANDRDFLLKCLTVARLDPELQSDVADACELHDFTALTVASGDLSVSDIEQKLYLTGDEAKVLIKVCERECAKIGVTFGRLIDPEPEHVVEEPATSANSVAAVPPVSTGREDSEPNVINLRLDVDTPTTPDLPEKNREASPRTQIQEKAQSSKKLPSPKPSNSPDNLPRPEKATTPTAQRLANRARPSSAPTEPRRQLSRSSSSGQPSSARKPPMRRTSSQRLDVDNESQASAISDGPVPSYLRPTAAHKARAKKSDNEHDIRPASAQSTPRKHNVPVPGFISNTLLRPTAAFLNRFVPAKDESGKWSPGEGGPRLTQSVSGPVTSSSRTPRNTRVQPFHLSTDLRGGKDKALSTDELQLQKAKEEMEKLKQVKSPRSKAAEPERESTDNSIKSFRAPITHSNKKPTQFRPFKLASLERHNKAQEELQRKIAEERQREEEQHNNFAKKSSRQLTSRMSSKKQMDVEASS